jgi:cephalosporin-C deacetylase
MPMLDLSLEELKTYYPSRNEPEDFDIFWNNTLSESLEFPLNASFNAVESPLTTLDVFDLTFNGFAGQQVKGWFLLPKNRKGRLPCIVEYLGYGDGRGFAHDWLLWSSLGYGHLVMDNRGQGSNGFPGDTPDFVSSQVEPHFPGFVTQGILDPKQYYYRRLFTDAVRAVEVARSNPTIDPAKIAITGRSQGGGITLAVAGLVRDVSAVMPDVPFNSQYRRATEISDRHPYLEIALYCKTHRDKVDQVFRTLSYFDGMNFSVRAKAHALFSTGLMDMICPPSTVFASYNWYAGPKEIRVYPFNEHEGGKSFHTMEQINFLKDLWR